MSENMSNFFGGGQATADGRYTNLLWTPNWGSQWSIDELTEAHEALKKKAMLVQYGLDQFTPAEKFAYKVLLHHAMLNGYKPVA